MKLEDAKPCIISSEDRSNPTEAETSISPCFKLVTVGLDYYIVEMHHHDDTVTLDWIVRVLRYRLSDSRVDEVDA